MLALSITSVREITLTLFQSPAAFTVTYAQKDYNIGRDFALANHFLAGACLRLSNSPRPAAFAPSGYSGEPTNETLENPEASSVHSKNLPKLRGVRGRSRL